MKSLVALFDSGYPVTNNGQPWTETRINWKIMDTYGYRYEDFCQKVDSMEIAFDVAAATEVNKGYIAFVDDALAIRYMRHSLLLGRGLRISFKVLDPAWFAHVLLIQPSQPSRHNSRASQIANYLPGIVAIDDRQAANVIT